MTTASGWTDLPLGVRHAVERIVGARVVEAVSQSGGFSPGTAGRVRTADGRRAFTAVRARQNELSASLHRREALATAALPPSVPAPRLLGCHDDGDWVALVLEDIEGRHPATPWVPDELERVLGALGDLARSATPSPVLCLAPWVGRHLDELCALAERASRRWPPTRSCTPTFGPTTCWSARTVW
jgi:hypothetical protein